MTRQIKLLSNEQIGSLIYGEPFLLLGDDELEIEFITDLNSVLLVTLCNGDVKKQIIVSNKRFNVPKALLCEGMLEMRVCVYNSIGLTNRWICEPITILQPQEEVFEGYPKITALESEIAELKAQMQVMDEVIKDLQNQVGRLWEVAES